MRHNKLFKSKKGFNDVVILSILGFILLFTSVIITPLNEAFPLGASTFDEEGNYQATVNAAENLDTRNNAFTIMKNVLKLSLWDIGDTLRLPFWLDIVFTLIGTVFIFTVARNLWIGGGS